VEVAADERPPVCKILDYGKLRFKNSQKGNKATKVRKQRLKEIRVRPKTGDHDIDTKIAHAKKFLEHHDKVQVTVIFRGREMQHQEEGRRVLDMVLAGLAGVGKVERPPTMDGRRMTAMLMPTKPLAKPKVKKVESGESRKVESGESRDESPSKPSPPSGGEAKLTPEAKPTPDETGGPAN
jgi:translation initiation factor IF-3